MGKSFLKIALITLIAIVLFLPIFYSGAKKLVLKPAPFQTTETKKLVDELYSRMNLEEKVAQLSGIRSSELVENGKLLLEKCRQKIPNGIGHISQYACALDMNANELREFVRELKAGETKMLVFQVSPEQLAHYHQSQCVIESGNYEIKMVLHQLILV